MTAWRHEQLARAGLPTPLARQLARDLRVDLHRLLELVERGCPLPLALRITTPPDEPGSAA